MLRGEGGEELVRGDALKFGKGTAGPPLRLLAQSASSGSELRAHVLPLRSRASKLQCSEDREGTEEPVERRPTPGAGAKLLEQRDGRAIHRRREFRYVADRRVSRFAQGMHHGGAQGWWRRRPSDLLRQLEQGGRTACGLNARGELTLDVLEPDEIRHLHPAQDTRDGDFPVRHENHRDPRESSLDLAQVSDPLCQERTAASEHDTLDIEVGDDVFHRRDHASVTADSPSHEFRIVRRVSEDPDHSSRNPGYASDCFGGLGDGFGGGEAHSRSRSHRATDASAKEADHVQ